MGFLSRLFRGRARKDAKDLWPRDRDPLDCAMSFDAVDITPYLDLVKSDGGGLSVPPGKIGMVCIMPNINLLRALLNDERIYIVAMVIPLHDLVVSELADFIRSNRARIGRILDASPKSYDEFFAMTRSDYNLAFDEIRQMERAHLKATRSMARHFLDMGETDYRYLHLLRFWLGVFDSREIRFVFSNWAEHGDLNDSIPLEIARQRKIPVYCFSVEFANSNDMAYSLRRIDLKGSPTCDMREIFGVENHIDMRKYFHDADCANRAQPNVSSVKAKWRDIVRTGHAIRNRAARYRAAYDRLTPLEAFHQDTDGFETWFRRNPLKVLSEWRWVKDLFRAYEAVSVKPVPGEKYVFYALHLEPEATILNRGCLRNQLYAIRMLADSLPPGWKLYVKEHPMQFSVASVAKESFFHVSNNIGYFRSKQFYAEICRLPNTRLIDISEDSRELIANAEAVSTISGTIGYETIVQSKPLLVFSDETNVISAVNGVFRLHSFADVKDAFPVLLSGYRPTYDNLAEVADHALVEEQNYREYKRGGHMVAIYEGIVAFILSKTGTTYEDQFA